MKYQKLNATKFGLAWGILLAIAMFLLGLISISGYGAGMVAAIGELYIGYTSTFGGAIIGAIWGFIDAFIGTWLFALIYNKLL